MSVQLTPSKRAYDQSNSEANGKGKLRKSANLTSPKQSSKNSRGSTVFRILCPTSKIGSVIGKGGSSISQIRQETGVKIKVEDTVAGCDERVIVISGTNKENEVVSEPSEKNNEETKPAEDIDNPDEGEDDVDKQSPPEGEDDVDKQSPPVEDLPFEKVASSVQKALLLVFERMAEGESELDSGDDESNKTNAFFVRLLVLTAQVGCLLGKSGSKIKQMSSESGAQIEVLPRDKLPAYAMSSDEVVQLSGSVDAIRKALLSVSQQLLENPPQEGDSLSGNRNGQSSQFSGKSHSRPDAFRPPSHTILPRGTPFAAGPRDGGIDFLGCMGPFPDALTFKLICPDEKVGGVIGKGGSVVKGLQQETGCDIKVLDSIPNSEDRVIVISGPVHPNDHISAAEDAVLRVQTRIVRATPESKEKSKTAKIIVSSNQVGCLLGKGGAVINEMRKSTGANIRLLSRDQTPHYIHEDEELVQIQGDFEAIQEALMQITSRLRYHFLRDAFPSNHPPKPFFLDHGPPFPPFAGRRAFSPPGRYSSFNQFDVAGGLPPPSGFHPLDDRPPFMQSNRGSVFPPHISGRMPPPAPWGPQGSMENGGPGGPLGFPEGVPQRRMGGFGGGGHQARITSTTMEVVVPSSVIPSLYGEDGGCLKEIREFSDAKITITDPKPGATNTLIVISGTPEQTHAAQSLIQAFVISESNEAA